MTDVAGRPGESVNTIQRVVIRAQFGRDWRRNTVLRPPELISVGEAASSTIRLPPNSGVQLRIECEPFYCRVSKHGENAPPIVVDDVSMDECLLVDDCSLSSGSVQIQFEFEHDDTLSRNLQTFSHLEWDNGLAQFLCNAAETTPLQVFDRLLESLECSLVVDVQAAGIHLPPRLQPTFLFDWLPRHQQWTMSPVILRDGEMAVRDIVEEAWHTNAVLCGFNDSQESVIGTLRDAARGKTRHADAPNVNHVWTSCRPNDLIPRLRESNADYADFLFGPLKALFFNWDCRGKWSIVSRPEFDSFLEELGLIAEPIRKARTN